MTRSARSLSGTLLSLRTEPVPGWSASRKLAAKMTARCRETVPSLGFPSFLLRERMDKPRNVDAKPIQQVVEGLINRCRLLFKGVENRSGVQFIQILKDRTGALCGDGIRGERGTGKILQVVGHDCFRTAAECCVKDMPIFLLVRHGRNQVLVAFHPGLSKMSADLALPVSRLLGCQAEIPLQIPGYLRH